MQRYDYHTGVKASSIAHAGILEKKKVAANRGFIEYTLDLLSIPEYVIKKEDLMATDMGKLQKRKNIIWPNNRFLRDPDFRKAMLEHDRDEEVCIKLDDLCRTRFHSLHDGTRTFSIQTKYMSLLSCQCCPRLLHSSLLT